MSRPLAESADLLSLMSAIRRGLGVSHGTKVLIILDQFEQWLHRRQDPQWNDLIGALRQCDGIQLQCLLTVRDDFWMAVTSVLADLEIELVQGSNIAPMDLFPVRHARKILTAFGQAFGELPERIADLTSDQTDFVGQAVDSLAIDAACNATTSVPEGCVDSGPVLDADQRSSSRSGTAAISSSSRDPAELFNGRSQGRHCKMPFLPDSQAHGEPVPSTILPPLLTMSSFSSNENAGSAPKEENSQNQ